MFGGSFSSSIAARASRVLTLTGLVGLALCAPQYSPFAGAQVFLRPANGPLHLRNPSVQRFRALQAHRALSPQMRLLFAPPPAVKVAPRPVTRLLIKLKPGVDNHAFAVQFSAAARQDPTLHAVVAADKPLLRYVRRHKGIGWTTYEVPSHGALQPTLNALLKNPKVLHAEPDYRILRLSLQPPNNHYWGMADWAHTYAVWGLGDTDESSAYSDDSTMWNYSWSQEQVSALQAWSIYPGHFHTASERMNLLANDPARLPVVGDIDTGIDLTHPNFSYTGNPSKGIIDTDVRHGGQLNIQFSRAFAGPNFDGYQGEDPTLAMDDYGHGTGTSGLIGSAPNTGGNDPAFIASNPNITWDTVGEHVYPSQLPGLGFTSQVVEMKVLDSQGDGSDSDIIDAMEYASADWTDPNTGITHPSPHCVILNMSLALDTTNYPQALQDAVDFCWNHGTLIVAAAGNDGSGAGGPGADTPRYPARCDKVLAVSATTYDYPDGGVPEQITSYSDYGYQIGVAAPGGDAQQYINSATGDFVIDPIPELINPFMLMPSYPVVLNDPNGQSADSLYAQLGFAGLYLGQLPGTSFAAPQVAGLAALYASKNRITQATPNGPQKIVNAIELGADPVDGVPNGGYDPVLGWGRINAAATIQDLNNRSATVGGCIGRLRYVDTVVGNVNVTAQAVSGGTVFPVTTDPDGLYHFVNMPAAPGGTVYNITATVFGVTGATQVKILPGCDQLGANLTISAALALQSFTLSPSTIVGSLNSTGTITLSSAPTTATTISLSSNSTTAAVPATVTVPAGKASQTFTITTNAVPAQTSVVLTATLGTSSTSATLTVTPFGVKSLTLSPTSVMGASPAVGTVSLQYPVNSDSVTVKLTTSNPAVAQPVGSQGGAISSIKIVAGRQTATFKIATYAVASSTPVTLVASANGISQTATLTVTPVGISAFTISPASVPGTVIAVGTVTLQAPAAPGDVTVRIISNNTAAAQAIGSGGGVITSIRVPAGRQSSTFRIATYSVSASTSVNFTVSANGTSQAAPLTVEAVGVSALSISPTSVQGTKFATGTVTLQTPAAPGDVTVKLSSSDTAVAQIVGSGGGVISYIKVPAGKQSSTFRIATYAVASGKTVTITASASGISKTATLTVTP